MNVNFFEGSIQTLGAIDEESAVKIQIGLERANASVGT